MVVRHHPGLRLPIYCTLSVSFSVYYLNSDILAIPLLELPVVVPGDVSAPRWWGLRTPARQGVRQELASGLCRWRGAELPAEHRADSLAGGRAPGRYGGCWTSRRR